MTPNNEHEPSSDADANQHDAQPVRPTPDEREALVILRAVARSRGWEWTARHAQLILDQARFIGNL